LGFRTFQQDHNPGFGHPLRVQSQVIKIVLDNPGCAVLFKSKLGMFVEIPSQIQEFLIQFFDSLLYFVHSGNPLFMAGRKKSMLPKQHAKE
jgi:hypothetical protein